METKKVKVMEKCQASQNEGIAVTAGAVVEKLMKRWVCKAINKFKISHSKFSTFKVRSQITGCTAAHPAHPLPTALLLPEMAFVDFPMHTYVRSFQG